MNKIVSIIMPTFNNQNTIIETIGSVLSQDVSSWELVIVDDGSSDNTLHLIENYCVIDSRIKLFRREKNPKGGSTCRNIGIQNASGEFILFLDADDLLEPFCIRQRLKAMTEYPDLEIGIFLMKKFYKRKEDGNEIVNLQNSTDPLIDYLSGRYPWTITCPIWKRSLLNELKGFNEKYERMQDPELHTRALLYTENYMKFYNYPADCLYRITPSKYISSEMLHKMIRAYSLYYQEFFELVNGNSKHSNAIKRSLNRFLFKISRMSNERSMLNEAVEVPKKIKMVSRTYANYLLLKYIVLQKTISILKKIRSAVRIHLLENYKNINYKYYSNKVL
jgi:glycosyltransferase involved in cell wall biosynthesis